MLVLSRKTGEFLTLTIPPTDVALTVSMLITCVRGDRVQIGFEAPLAVSIVRNEKLTDPVDTRPMYQRQRKAMPAA